MFNYDSSVQPVSATPFTGFGTCGAGNITNSSAGTDKVMVNGSIYWAEVPINYNCTITGVLPFTGTVGGTDKWIVALYDSTGKLLANSALAGTNAAASNTKARIAFTAPVAVTGPGRYFVSLQGNGTTARFLAHPNASEGVVTGSTTGTFGTLPNPLTVGSTFTSGVGPIANLY